MDSRLHALFIPMVGGVLDGEVGCGVVRAPGLRGKFSYELQQSV